MPRTESKAVPEDNDLLPDVAYGSDELMVVELYLSVKVRIR